MKKQNKYFLISIIVILFSSPLGYLMINTIYANRNLASEYIPLLNGFIYSFMLIGALLFSIGLIELISNKKNNI